MNYEQMEFEELVADVDVRESMKMRLMTIRNRYCETLKRPKKLTTNQMRLCERMAVGCNDILYSKERE